MAREIKLPIFPPKIGLDPKRKDPKRKREYAKIN